MGHILLTSESKNLSHLLIVWPERKNERKELSDLEPRTDANNSNLHDSSDLSKLDGAY